jgi:hypothetical protein
MIVDKPDDGRSVRARSNQGVARLVLPPHSPHDGGLVVYEGRGDLGQTLINRQSEYQPELRLIR